VANHNGLATKVGNIFWLLVWRMKIQLPGLVEQLKIAQGE